jgi:hypothetical protein
MFDNFKTEGEKINKLRIGEITFRYFYKVSEKRYRVLIRAEAIHNGNGTAAASSHASFQVIQDRLNHMPVSL